MKTCLISIGIIFLYLVCSSQPSQFKLDLPQSYQAVPSLMFNLLPAKDGSLIFAACADSGQIFPAHYRLILTKLNANGTVQWSNQYRYFSKEWRPATILELPDSSFLIAGGWNGHMIILKADKDGNELFSKLYTPATIYTPYMEWFVPVQFCMKNDSTVLLAGNIVNQQTSGGYLEMDFNGNIKNSLFFKHRGYNTTCDNIILSQDNNILLMTLIEKDTFPMRFCPGIIKLDSAGNVLWSHDYDDGIHTFLNNPTGSAVLSLGIDGIVIVAGYGLNNLITGTVLLKTDSDGKLDWGRVLEPEMRDEQLHALWNSNFLLTSTMQISGPAHQIALLFNKDGEQLDGHEIDPPQFPLGWGSASFVKNNYLSTVTLSESWSEMMFTHRSYGDITCNETSLTTSMDSITLFDSSGVDVFTTNIYLSNLSVNKMILPQTTYLECGTLDVADEQVNRIKFFPNPARDLMMIDVEQQIDAVLKIADVHGKMIREWKQQLPAVINIAGLAEGIYVINVKTQNESNNAVIVKTQ